MISVTQKIPIYEVSGQDVQAPNAPTMTVKSHWNEPDKVVIELHGQPAITVAARDLAAAISNAQNTARHG